MQEEGEQGSDFSDLLQVFLLSIISVFVVFGGTVPFVFQYLEIRKTQNARGFSLYVCLTLLAANISRVMFWIGKRFETLLLLQSFVMIGMMLILVHRVVVTKRRQMLPPAKHRSLWNGDLKTGFWNWTDFSSFLMTVALFSTFMALMTNLLLFSSFYVESLGFLSLFLEGNLGTPQLLNNWTRKSTVGMSIRMVLMWFLGDISKTVYFLIRDTPMQFWLCGMYQIMMDILILSQVFFYRGSSAVHHKYDTPPSTI